MRDGRPGKPIFIEGSCEGARHGASDDLTSVDIAWGGHSATPMTRRRLAAYLVAWATTAAVQIPTVDGAVTSVAGVDQIAFAALAGLLLGFLYFLNGWANESLKSDDSNPVLVCWMSLLCSVSICLTAVVAFGIQACLSAKGLSPDGVVGVLSWAIPLTFVSCAAAGLSFMLIGLLRWYAIAFSVEATVSFVVVSEDMLDKAWLLPWRWYFNRGILVFIGMGVASACWVLSTDSERLIAAFELILCLFFGLFGVGVYATGLGHYIPRIRSWYSRNAAGANDAAPDQPARTAASME